MSSGNASQPPSVRYSSAYKPSSDTGLIASRAKALDKVMSFFCLTWCHVIVKELFLNDLLEWKHFEWSEIGCECTCAKLDTTHYHLLGRVNCAEKTVRRFFQSCYEKAGVSTKQGSNFYYKFLKINNEQHYLFTALYILREKYDYKSMTVNPDPTPGMGNVYLTKNVSKHFNFVPFGDTDFSRLPDTIQGNHLEWSNIYEYLTNAGYRDFVTKVKSQYEAYKELKAQRKQHLVIGARRARAAKSSIGKSKRTNPLKRPGTSTKKNSSIEQPVIETVDQLLRSVDYLNASQRSENLDSNLAQGDFSSLPQYSTSEGNETADYSVNGNIEFGEISSGSFSDTDILDNGND